jgi:hypothetical protein
LTIGTSVGICFVAIVATLNARNRVQITVANGGGCASAALKRAAVALRDHTTHAAICRIFIVVAGIARLAAHHEAVPVDGCAILAGRQTRETSFDLPEIGATIARIAIAIITLL